MEESHDRCHALYDYMRIAKSRVKSRRRILKNPDHIERQEIWRADNNKAAELYPVTLIIHFEEH